MSDKSDSQRETALPGETPDALLVWSAQWRALLRRSSLLTAMAARLAETRGAARRLARTPRARRWLSRLTAWRATPASGPTVLLLGSVVIAALAWLTRQAFPLPTLGAAYIPLIAMLAYYWGWWLGLAGCVLQAFCVYFILLPPNVGFKALQPTTTLELLVLAGVSVYVLLLVQLARNRSEAAEREVARVAALNVVSTALVGELEEDRLLQLIASTACKLTGATFAAFTLRPVDALGRPIAPAEGSHFHLAAVVGVTPEQEELFRRVPLGGEGLLAPIFRNGVSVRVDDALAMAEARHAHGDDETLTSPHESPREAARRQALSYAHGNASADELRTVGVPRGHPVVRSFLGAPLLDHEGAVRGGLLLGHAESARFTDEDEKLLRALAAQAAVVLENARLYHRAQSQAVELSAVFESIADGVMVYDEDGALLHENHAAGSVRQLLDSAPERQTGLAILNQLITDGGHVAETTPHGELAPITLTDAQGEAHAFVVSASLLQQISAGEPASALTKLSGQPSTAKPPSGVVLTWHEVTETRKLLAEREARAEAETRRALLQQVIDEQPGGVYLVQGLQGHLALANRAAREAWGAIWPEGQSMAQFLATSGVQILGSGGRLLAQDELATLRTLRTGEAIRQYQEIIRHPDGVTLPVLLNTVALDPLLLPTSSSEPEPAALVVLQDVTAMKEAERLKDEFIAIAAHELKTPMAAVKGYSDMLTRQTSRDGASALEPWQVEALETIDQATNRLVELTDDLLDVARLQAERLQLHAEPHDLIALARRVLKRFRMASDHHTLILSVTDEYVVAELDVRRTEQIIGNLLSNAIKYSPDGGTVTVAIEQDGQFATLSVRDEGIGIPANQQAMLFNRFVRADNARERGISGTGLGLYLCRELAELQGGRLWFDSQEDHGSVFYLTAPLAAENAQG